MRRLARSRRSAPGCDRALTRGKGCAAPRPIRAGGRRGEAKWLREGGKRRGGSRRRGDRPSESDWLYGLHPVREALRAGRRKIARVWLRDGAERAGLLGDRRAGPVVRCPRRGGAAPCDRRTDCSEAQSQCGSGSGAASGIELGGPARGAAAEGGGAAPPILLALDGVEDPQNCRGDRTGGRSGGGRGAGPGGSAGTADHGFRGAGFSRV